MWIALNLIVLVVVGAVILGGVAAAWIAALVVLALGRRRRWHPVVRTGPLLIVILATAGAGLVAWRFIAWSLRPSTAYAEVFDRQPDASVAEIHSDTSTLGDAGHVDVWFRCPRSTFDELTHGYDASGDQREALLDEMRRLRPFGWDPTSADALVIRTRTGSWPAYANSATVVAFDAQRRFAFAHRWGID